MTEKRRARKPYREQPRIKKTRQRANDKRGKKQPPSQDEQHPREVEFLIVTRNADFGDEKLKSPRNTGTLVDLDGMGAGMLTRVPLQPGDMVRLDHEGTSKLGVVMWSVESSNNYRVQMRFL